MTDSRAESCRGYDETNGKVTGVRLEHLPAPSTTYELIRATWTMIYAQDELQAERAAHACFRAGIMPVVRVGKLIDENVDSVLYVEALRKALQGSGFAHDPDKPPLYVQIFNEPEADREWLPREKPDGWSKRSDWPQVFGSNWARQAAAVFDAGGYPGIQVLDRGGFDAAVNAGTPRLRAAADRRRGWLVARQRPRQALSQGHLGDARPVHAGDVRMAAPGRALQRRDRSADVHHHAP